MSPKEKIKKKRQKENRSMTSHRHGGVLTAILFTLIVTTFISTFWPFSFLKEEVSIEPQSLDLDVIPGENLAYNLTIRNIGSEKINLSNSVNGINWSWIKFTYMNSSYHVDNNSALDPSKVKILHIEMRDLSAPSGKYKGDITILNNDNNHTLESLPLTLNVKEINLTAKDPVNQSVKVSPTAVAFFR